MKLMHTHFNSVRPLSVNGNSPRGSHPKPTYTLDVTAAISAGKKKLIFSMVNPTEEQQRLSPNGYPRLAGGVGSNQGVPGTCAFFAVSSFISTPRPARSGGVMKPF